MAILVTGAAGYVGSHVCRHLLARNYDVIALDNLSSGFRQAVPASARFVEGDVGDEALIRELAAKHSITDVMHFAAHVEVEESVREPLKYYFNNSVKSFTLFNTCRDLGIYRIVFSSTAAIYGEGTSAPAREDQTPAPINPYGRSKLIAEMALKDLAAADPKLRHVTFRYFNVAGASMDGSWGQATRNATHLIKLTSQAALGLRPELSIFGFDYPTPDGTCVRDYIHVDDLAQAHVLALEYLHRGGVSVTLNCGYGRGYSVKEVAETMRRVSGREFPITRAGRRAGDPASLTADTALIRKTLGWEPQYDSLEGICLSAFEWEQKLVTLREQGLI